MERFHSEAVYIEAIYISIGFHTATHVADRHVVEGFSPCSGSPNCCIAARLNAGWKPRDYMP